MSQLLFEWGGEIAYSLKENLSVKNACIVLAYRKGDAELADLLQSGVREKYCHW